MRFAEGKNRSDQEKKETERGLGELSESGVSRKRERRNGAPSLLAPSNLSAFTTLPSPVRLDGVPKCD